MTCKELVEWVTDYLEGKLPDETRQDFEEHLTICTGCRRYLDQMRKTIHVAGKLTENDISDEAEAELLDLFRNWKQSK